jgi:dipeptidyl aminopeptidase/acylaminoacyl peptidase
MGSGSPRDACPPDAQGAIPSTPERAALWWRAMKSSLTGCCRSLVLLLGLFAPACSSALWEPPPATTIPIPPPPRDSIEREQADPWGDEEASAEGLIPRELLFGNPDRASPRISPDGKRIAYLAPDGGVLNVWVAPADAPTDAKVITRDRKRGIRRFLWAYTSEHVVYLQDRDGDENWRAYSVEVKSGKAVDLSPLEGVRTEIEKVSHKHPHEILIGLNDRDKRHHDIHKVDIRTGKRRLVQLNEEGYGGFVTDDDLAIRFANKPTDDGGEEILRKDGDRFVAWAKIAPEDSLTTGFVGFDASGKVAYMYDSRGRDTAAFTRVALPRGKAEVIYAHDKADTSDVLIHPTKRSLQAVAATYLRKEWHPIDAGVKSDLETLRKLSRGDVEVSSRTLDDQRWTVAFIADDGPARYYLYDRKTKKASYLFSNREALEDLALGKMHPVEIKTRDGLTLVSYLTLPVGVSAEGIKPRQPLPMVMLVHGGPWSRDSWGYDAMHQWMANRGYAVLSVNFRGSTGFGKRFINAGDREWAGKMHLDLVDAVKWAVDGGIARADKVAIMGGSYGGYATLVGLTFTPDLFACGVDIVGPSNLVTLLDSIPPYWAPYLALFKRRVGDHQSPEGKKFLLSRSPLSRADAIVRPLLIGQGANDPRVKQAESDQIVKAMQEKKIPVTYVLYPDEGHGFARPENRTSFQAVSEAFLARCLGGPSEPFGDDLAGASLQLPAGADYVPGLKAALAEK